MRVINIALTNETYYIIAKIKWKASKSMFQIMHVHCAIVDKSIFIDKMCAVFSARSQDA